MIYTVTLNPAVDRTIELDHIKLGGLNRVKSTRLDASGKGINVSRVIHSLGGESIALGFLGGKNGLFIYEKIQELGIREAFIRIQNSTRMNIKVLENETKQVTEFNEKGPVIKDNEINELKRLLKENVKNEDFIIFSGSVPKNIPDSIYRELIQLLPREVKTILDSDGPLLKEGIKASPFLIKTNLGEFCRLTGIQSENFAKISAAAKKLSEERSTSILLSMGDRGALYFENNCKGNIYKIEPLDIKVSSAMGAGDALLAGFVYTLMKKSSLKEALKKATACAAASVSMEGTQPGPLALVEQLESKVKIQEK